jgi:hypothetical protein
MLLGVAERRLGIADRLAGLIGDRRNPRLVRHSAAGILRARMLAIACGHEDANDLDHLRADPGFKLACERLPDTGDAEAQAPALGRHAEARYGAKSWGCTRRVAARIEASAMGLDIRTVVTNLQAGSAKRLYDTLCCARGQAENLIKLHKSQLASDRTSCRSHLANQVRLILRTAAYWLMLSLRDAIPKPQPLAGAEFTTLRTRPIKIATRITETATRVRIAFASACPEAEFSVASPTASSPPGRDARGQSPS